MRILLVDDETSVIQALLAVLKSLPGHDVRVATTGEKALENASAMGGLDVLISDVVMEPMDGFTLRDQLVARYPRVRTIFISGYDLSDYAAQTAAHQFLPKPVDAQVLVAAVQKELAALAVPVAAKATVAPKATAVATPRAVAAVPTAAPVPRATVAPVARAAAVPVARAVAAPAAQPTARAAVPMPVAAPPPAPQVSMEEAGGESLIGQTIGSYQVLSHLGAGRLGSAYAAVQISINRPVGLKVLDPSRAGDEATKARFIADARAKAHVQHPSILAVYEAGESDGRTFYAREFVDGQSMAEIAASGKALDETTALKIIKAVAEGFVYLHLNNIPHRPLDATKVFLGADNQPRLANLAVQIADEHLTTEQEIQILGQLMFRVVPGGQILSRPLAMLLGRMAQAPTSGLNAWGAVLQAVKALEPKNIPVEAMKISEQDRKAIEAVELARKQQKRSLWINVASITTLFLVVVFLFLKKFVFTNERAIQKMVRIPSGLYKLPGGKEVTIEKDFWIDKYEITWAQYGRFVEFLDKNPTADQDLRHPRMPRYLEHRPKNWDIFYGQARANGKAHKVPIDLNCPVMEISWWDAYAYAKWLGTQTGTERDLPSVEEWEVAAAGDKAYRYPWGNEFDKDKANTNADFQPRNPGAKGTVDGFNFWGPVDGIGADKSPFGIIGLAGNVSEWTSTWTEDNRLPVVKGGNFSIGATSIDKNLSNHDPNKGEEFIGFRTISRTPPPDAEEE